MKFEQWLHLREQAGSAMQAPETAQGPDPREVSYVACVLHRNSQLQLLGDVDKLLFEETGSGLVREWVKRAHHMTVLRPTPTAEQIRAMKLGMEVNLKVTHVAQDDHCVAVVVEPLQNLVVDHVPHVTVAHSRDVGPKYSNDLLSEHSNWRPVMAEIYLLSYLLAVGRDQSQVWPSMGSLLLASPSL